MHSILRTKKLLKKKKKKKKTIFVSDRHPTQTTPSNNASFSALLRLAERSAGRSLGTFLSGGGARRRAPFRLLEALCPRMGGSFRFHAGYRPGSVGGRFELGSGRNTEKKGGRRHKTATRVFLGDCRERLLFF